MPAYFRHNDTTAINDYIVDSDSIPLMTGKNRDRTLLATEFEFAIINTYTKPAKGDTIKVYSNSSTLLPFFSGKVLKVKTNYNNDTYLVYVISDFYQLEQIKLTYSNLHAQLLQTSSPLEYIASDNFSLPNVQVLWAIKSMFRVAGFNLEISTALQNEVLQTITYLGSQYNMRIRDLVLDENVLYALNQSVAINTTGINADTDKVALQLSFFDFIKEFCSHIGAHIYPYIAGSPTYYILDMEGTPTPGYSNDLIYNKEVDELDGTNQGYVHNLLFNSDRNTYNSSTASNLADHQYTYGDGRDNIEVISNWIYMWRKRSDMGGTNGDVLGHAYPSLCWNANDFLANRINATKNNFRETTNVVNHFLPTNTKEARLNVQRDEAELTFSEVI